MIVATAGSRGFDDLVAACRALEAAIAAGTGLPDAVTEARRGAAATRSRCMAA